MSLLTVLVVVAGSLLGGFVSGLAGFGTGLVALGIWLLVASPAEAAALVMICSVVSQLATLHTIRRSFDLRQVWPMIVAGLAGVPIGVALLATVSPDRFRLAMGLVIIAFSALMLLGRSRPRVEGGGRLADAAVGFGGGVLGGFAGLSGPLPIMWAALRGWSKDRRRALFQSYNLAVLLASFVGVASGGLLTTNAAWMVGCALPGTLAGAWLGAWTYRHVTDVRFDALVLWVLTGSGLMLVWSALR